MYNENKDAFKHRFKHILSLIIIGSIELLPVVAAFIYRHQILLFFWFVLQLLIWLGVIGIIITVGAILYNWIYGWKLLDLLASFCKKHSKEAFIEEL